MLTIAQLFAVFSAFYTSLTPPLAWVRFIVIIYDYTQPLPLTRELRVIGTCFALLCLPCSALFCFALLCFALPCFAFWTCFALPCPAHWACLPACLLVRFCGSGEDPARIARVRRGLLPVRWMMLPGLVAFGSAPLLRVVGHAHLFGN